MNPAYFGDSYDLVKRFFCGELAALGYTVLIDPMLTGEWSGAEQQFFRLVGATPVGSVLPSDRTALLIDPDTGVHHKAGGRHVSIAKLASLAKVHGIVAAFDQSFSRKAKYPEALHAKLAELQGSGAHGMYYDSHARFIFATAAEEPLAEFRSALVRAGLPETRLVGMSSNPSIEPTSSSKLRLLPAAAHVER